MREYKAYHYELARLKEATPLMQYQKGEPFENWQEKAREKLIELLGLPTERCEPQFQLEYEKAQGNYTEYRFTVQTEEGYVVPCHLLVPAGKVGKTPLAVCLMGHGSGMHLALGLAKSEKDQQLLDEWPHRAMAPRAVREGRCALVIEARAFGESSDKGYGTSCTEAAKTALLMGRTLQGERVWDVMRVLDAVALHFPQVDMTDIVCTGNSGGGTATFYLACLDERITAAAPSCSICSFEGSIAAMPHCLCNHIPGIRKYFEMGDLAGLIAPRILVVAAGEKDDIFPIESTRQNFEKIQKLYDVAGAGDRCALVIGEQGHYNYADLLWSKMHQMGVQ